MHAQPAVRFRARIHLPMERWCGSVRPGCQARSSASRASAMSFSSRARYPASDLLTLLDECAVAGKQLHIVADRTNLIISRENLHNEARLRETFDSRLKGQVQSCRRLCCCQRHWSRDQRDVPQRPQRVRRFVRGQYSVARRQHILVSNHVDGSTGAHRRGGPRSPPQFIEPATSLPRLPAEKGRGRLSNRWNGAAPRRTGRFAKSPAPPMIAA